MSIGRICQREVAFAHPDESALDAAVYMRERNVGTLVVIDELNRPTGMLTDRDLVTHGIATDRSAREMTILEIMTDSPKTITEETPIDVAPSLMQAGGFRRLPVVNSKGEITGLVSLDDILCYLFEQFVQISDLLAKERPRPESIV